MSTTIKKVIESSLREIQALAEGEEASADMIADALELLNDLIASWSDEGFMIPYVTRDTLAGDNTKSSYTWGSGGDITTTAPVNVVAVSFVLENAQHDLLRGSEQLFKRRPVLGIIGNPTYFYFDRQSTPQLHFDVAPYGGTFYITSEKPLDNTLTLTENFALPDRYKRMVRTNLGIELCPAYEKSPSAALVAIARQSRSIVKKSNAKPVPDMRFDFPSGSGASQLPLRES